MQTNCFACQYRFVSETTHDAVKSPVIIFSYTLTVNIRAKSQNKIACQFIFEKRAKLKWVFQEFIFGFWITLKAEHYSYAAPSLPARNDQAERCGPFG